MRAHRESASAGTARPRRRHWAAGQFEAPGMPLRAAALRQPAPHSGGSPPTSALRHRRVRCPGAAAGNGRRAARGRPGESPLAGQERAGVVAPAVQWAPPATAGAPPAGGIVAQGAQPVEKAASSAAAAAVEQFEGQRQERLPRVPMNHPQRHRFAQALFAECRQQPARRAIAEQFGERQQGLFVGPAKRRGQSPAPAAAVPAGAAPALRRRRAATAAAADSRLARAPAGRRRHAAPASPARPVPAALAAIAGNCRRDSGRHGIRAGPLERIVLQSQAVAAPGSETPQGCPAGRPRASAASIRVCSSAERARYSARALRSRRCASMSSKGRASMSISRAKPAPRCSAVTSKK